MLGETMNNLKEQTEGLTNNEYLGLLERKFDTLEAKPRSEVAKYLPGEVVKRFVDALFEDNMPGVDAYGEALKDVQALWPVEVEVEDGDLMALVEDDRYLLTYLDKRDFRKVVFFVAKGLELLPERPTQEDLTRLIDITIRAETLSEEVHIEA